MAREAARVGATERVARPAVMLLLSIGPLRAIRDANSSAMFMSCRVRVRVGEDSEVWSGCTGALSGAFKAT
jgi:hypothetical protein